MQKSSFSSSDNTENGSFYIYEDLQVTKSGTILTIEGKKKAPNYSGSDDIAFSLNVDFSTPNAPAITNFELQCNGYKNVSYNLKTNVEWSLKAKYIPLEKLWKYGGTKENYVFSATEADGLKITEYSNSSEHWIGGEEKEVWKLLLNNNPRNVIGVTISYP